jgi:integrating conjugative element protein (TIGR03752 family)
MKSRLKLLEAVPQAPNPDADSPADTIKTLTANVSAMTSELSALRRDNTALKQENRDLNRGPKTDRKQRADPSADNPWQPKRSDTASPETTSAIAALTARVDSLTNRYGQSAKPSSAVGSDIPVGLGLGGVSAPSANSESLVWVNPLELSPSPGEDKETLLNRFSRTGRSALDSAGPPVQSLVAKGADALNSTRPVYTVPRNATLIGSTAMTALVGRVPVQGQVRDPMPFKVITGADNLAANGLRCRACRAWSGAARPSATGPSPV